MRLVEEKYQKLTKVMNKPGQLHPFRPPISPHGLRRLQQVLNLAQLCVRVTLIDQRVQFLNSLPHRHLGPGLRVKSMSGFQIVGNGLLGVLLQVEVLNAIARVLIIAEDSLVFFSLEFAGVVNICIGVIQGGCGLGLGLQIGFEDVDIVDGIGGLFQLESIPRRGV